MMKSILFLVVAGMLTGCASRSAEEFKEGGREIGQGFKRIGQETGETVKKTGQAIGEGFKKAGKETGKAMKEMGQDISNDFKQ